MVLCYNSSTHQGIKMLSNILTANLSIQQSFARPEMEFTDIDKAYAQAEMLTSLGFEATVKKYGSIFIVDVSEI